MKNQIATNNNIRIEKPTENAVNFSNFLGYGVKCC